jgi:diaminopimelate decarboxylase
MSTWALGEDGSGALSVHGVVLRDVLERWGSPLHVVDASRLAENAARFLARPAGAGRGCVAPTRGNRLETTPETVRTP